MTKVLWYIQHLLILTCKFKTLPLAKSRRIRTKIDNHIIYASTNATNQLCLLFHKLKVNSTNYTSL